MGSVNGNKTLEALCAALVLLPKLRIMVMVKVA
jgi:hypothetical protein